MAAENQVMVGDYESIIAAAATAACPRRGELALRQAAGLRNPRAIG
jgi:hypothetical protein